MIQIYVREGCPYCQKVERAVIKTDLKQGTDYEFVDAGPNTPGREVVIKVGGKEMVPFLIDGETSMYESDDIVEYLKNKK